METTQLKDIMVYAESLSYKYKDKAAVQDVNLTVKPGEIFGLIGADGAGKTTTIQMLCGLLDPPSGLIFIDGNDVQKEPDLIRTKIGYMSQNFTLYPDLSVEENIDFVAGLKGVKGDALKRQKERLLSFSRMSPFRNRRSQDLSGGMKKKLGLSCALIHKPKVLILDEPTTAVDPISRGDLWRILYEFILQGITILISTPYMDEAERCNRVALMQEGKILACDTPDNLKKLVKRKIVSCKCEQLHEACNLINEGIGYDAQIYGDQIRIFMPSEIADPAQITASLSDKGLQLTESEEVSPNMDDVYMALLANKDKSAINWIDFVLPEIGSTTIELCSVTKKFKEFVAVDSVSFKVKKGSVFGLLGPNGAGKTTLIKIMCGLVPPTDGKAQVADYDIKTQPRMVKSRIGYMSQLFSLYPDLTVNQNLDLYASIYQLNKQIKNIRKQWVLDLAGLNGKENHLAEDLAGGWKQKLALGCSVIHQPSVLFLDEPTSGVDPVARQEFWDVIYRFSNEGITIIVTTHFLDEAERCNTLGLMSAGKLIALGSPGALKQDLPVDFFELSSPDTLKAYDKLLSLDYLSQASLFGEKIHVSCVQKDKTENIKNRIISENINISNMIKIQPSLEDVFIYHILSSGS